MAPITATWLESRVIAWQDLHAQLPTLEDNKPVSHVELEGVVDALPELARDLAVARRDAPESRTTAYLEQIYRRLHRVVHQPPRSKASELIPLLRAEIPEITYTLRWQIVCIGLGFILSGLAGWWLVGTYPELAGLFASQQMIETVESGELWTDGLLNVVPSSLLSLQIFTNNIAVALTAMALGVLYGLGTIYIIGLNGLMLGGIFALTAQHGLAGKLFDFVVAHGCVELSVIVVAGAVGFSLGEAIASPGEQSRVGAFRAAAERGMKLMALCVVFLIGAGFIEGYISPNPDYNRSVRVVIGVAYWLVFVLSLMKRGQRETARFAASP